MLWATILAIMVVNLSIFLIQQNLSVIFSKTTVMKAFFFFIKLKFTRFFSKKIGSVGRKKIKNKKRHYEFFHYTSFYYTLMCIYFWGLAFSFYNVYSLLTSSHYALVRVYSYHVEYIISPYLFKEQLCCLHERLINVRADWFTWRLSAEVILYQ